MSCCSYDPFRGFLRAIDTYVLGSLADEGHAYVIMFDWFLAGVVALMTRSGGAQGLADGIVKYAKTRKMTMFFCFLCGCAIFFDGAPPASLLPAPAAREACCSRLCGLPALRCSIGLRVRRRRGLVSAVAGVLHARISTSGWKLLGYHRQNKLQIVAPRFQGECRKNLLANDVADWKPQRSQDKPGVRLDQAPRDSEVSPSRSGVVSTPWCSGLTHADVQPPAQHQ